MTQKRGERKRKVRQRSIWIARLLASGRALALTWRLYRQTPPKAQFVIGIVTVITLWLSVNWVIQVFRKPTELFFPVSNTLNKTPRETWAKYGSIFRKHATQVISADLLAALAQAEGAGNPVARTYWRWSLTSRPFEIYKPASSAVGMYQITDGTFEIAKQLCIHDHAVVEEGSWYDWRSCWFNVLYSRVVASHAVEMTSAQLDREVSKILYGSRAANASLQQKQNLAAIIHLCGSSAGAGYVRRGMRFLRNQHCGDHDASDYLARINSLRSVFTRLQKEEEKL